MTAAAHTSGLPNPPTGKDCLLAVARWLVALLVVHWLVACAREVASALQLGPTDPDDSFLLRHFGTTDAAVILPRVTRALRRAIALEADLHARRPTEQDFTIETGRAIAAEVVAICRDLGILRRNPTDTVARRAPQRAFHHARVDPTARRSQACPIGPLRGPIPSHASPCESTGPPGIHRGDAENAELKFSNAGVPRRFSGRVPASFSLYAPF